MDKDEQLIDSLIKEHAKHGGVDEQFLTEVEEKINQSEDDNIIGINRHELASKKDWKKGVGIGVAACAALCVAGTILWEKKENRVQTIALDSESAESQIANSYNEVREHGMKSNVELKPKSRGLPSQSVTDSVRREQNEIGGSKRQIEELATILNAPVEPAVDFSDSNNFGEGLRMKEIVQSEPMSEVEKKPSAPSASRSKVIESDAFANRDIADVAKSKKLQLSKPLGGKDAMAGRALKLDESPAHQEHRRRLHLPEKGWSSKYDDLVENSFIAPTDDESKRSTFAIDVDTAAYANTRRMIQSGTKVPANAVRIEEMVNYFDYQYKQPEANAEHPFAVQIDSATCPWNADNKLVRVALQGKDIVRAERPASNLVFLLDVSGSMNATDKLPLLKSSLKYLLEEMDERDSVSMVVYAGASGLVLPATKADAEGRVKILNAMDNLKSGGSTAGGAGIKLAYRIAQENFIKGGVNRVILATDGDFNVGVSSTDDLTELVKSKAKKGVDVSVLGFGRGNLNDQMLESITNNGNGNYSYIDTIKEGRKVLLEDMTGTLVTIAKDVKVQVEFNPNQVKEYRLIGYANRKLPNSAFTDKRADAGEVGAGHNVTAFYEVVPGKALDKSELEELRYAKRSVKEKALVDADTSTNEHSDELLFVKLAYKQPHERTNDESTYLSVPLNLNDKDWKQADEDFKFASSVALFGMLLRDSDHTSDGNLDLVAKLAEAGKGLDRKGYREEFIKLVKKVKEQE